MIRNDTEYKRQFRVHDQKNLVDQWLEKKNYRSNRRRLEMAGSSGLLRPVRKSLSKSRPLHIEIKGKITLRNGITAKEKFRICKILPVGDKYGKVIVNQVLESIARSTDQKLSNLDRNAQSPSKLYSYKPSKYPTKCEKSECEQSDFRRKSARLTEISQSQNKSEQSQSWEKSIFDSKTFINQPSSSTDGKTINIILPQNFEPAVKSPEKVDQACQTDFQFDRQRKIDIIRHPFAAYGAGDQAMTVAGKRTFNVKSGDPAKIYESAIRKARLLASPKKVPLTRYASKQGSSFIWSGHN